MQTVSQTKRDNGDAGDTATDSPPLLDEIETTLADVRAFCDDPVALIERALYLIRRGRLQATLIALMLPWGLDEWGRRILHVAGAIADAVT